MSPLVTVVVPLYNKAATVRRCLLSIYSQTFRDFEIVLIDDGSTDAGASIAAESADMRLRIVKQPNAGPGAARNRGIAEAQGEILAFLDADDEWLPTFLERSVHVLRERINVTAVTSGYLHGPQGRSTADYWLGRGLKSGEVRISSATSPDYVVTLLAYMNPWATVVRCNAIRRYGGFYEHGCRYGEDNYLWLKLVLNEMVFVEIDPLVHWHDESSALSRNLTGPRPIEPFFFDPGGLYAMCPAALQSLLRSVLAIRAGKTAAMLSFWGRWRDGRDLVSRFSTLHDVRYCWVSIGRAASTPIGSMAGMLVRTFLSALPNSGNFGSASFVRHSKRGKAR